MYNLSIPLIIPIFVSLLYFLIGFGILTMTVNHAPEPTLWEKILAIFTFFFWPLWIPIFLVCLVIVIGYGIWEGAIPTVKHIVKWFRLPNRKQKS